MRHARAFVGAYDGRFTFALDDPLLFKYLVSHMSEPRGWEPNDKDRRLSHLFAEGRLHDLRRLSRRLARQRRLYQPPRKGRSCLSRRNNLPTYWTVYEDIVYALTH